MSSLITKTGKYEVRKYNKSHLLQLREEPEAKKVIDFIGFDTMDSSLQTSGSAFSAFYEGKLFYMGGINVLWGRVGEAWAMFGPSFMQHGFFIHRITIRFVNRIVDDLKIERLQAVVLKEHWAGMQWVDRLGFTYEGEMEKYFQGKTYLRYARLY